MSSVVYHGRALPLAWLVIKAKKGHFPEQTHCALLAQVAALLPADAHVTFRGDGEFDGCALQAALRQLNCSMFAVLPAPSASPPLVSNCTSPISRQSVALCAKLPLDRSELETRCKQGR